MLDLDFELLDLSLFVEHLLAELSALFLQLLNKVGFLELLLFCLSDIELQLFDLQLQLAGFDDLLRACSGELGFDLVDCVLLSLGVGFVE